MPLKKHRRHMRNHENCFSANEAVDWLHNFLQKSSTFGSDVSRQQTVQLLQKFLKAGVFEKIGVHSKDNQKDEFKDNSQLYRFSYSTSSFSTRYSPLRNLTRVPLSILNINAKRETSARPNSVNFLSDKRSCNAAASLCTEHLPECCFVSRNMSVKEVEEVWKTLTISRLQHVLCLTSLDDLLDDKQIDGHIIMHNATRFSKSGVVMLTDKTDDIPYWVISAMKCLTNCIKLDNSKPKHLNEETRIKEHNEAKECKTVVSFPSFENMLAQFSLKPNQTNAKPEHKTSTPLYQSEELNFVQEDSGRHKQTILSDTCSSHNYLYNESSKELCYETAFINVSPITRLIVNESKETNHCGSHSSLYTTASQATSGIETASTISACSHINPRINGENHSSDTPEQSIQTVRPANDFARFSSHENSCGISGLHDTRRCASVDNLKQSVCELSPKNRYSYVCAVTTLPRKSTSQVSEKSLPECKRYGSLKRLTYGQKHMMEDILRESQNLPSQSQTPVLNVHNSRFTIRKSEVSELHRTNTVCTSKHSFSNSSVKTCSNVNVIQSDNCEVENKSFKRTKYGVNCKKAQNITNVPHNGTNPSPGSPLNITWKADEMLLKKPTFQFARKTILNSFKIPFYRPPTPIACSKLVNLKVISLDECLTNATANDALPPRPEPEGASSCNSILDKSLESKISEAFQLSLLMIPTPNRRHLHLLLRTLNKMINNDKLILHPYKSTRDFLLETFARSIACAENEVEYNESQGLKLVSFLLDQCEILFQVPSSLKGEVEEQLACRQRGKIKYTLDDSCTLTYCEQVSLQQYEEQKNALSRQSLLALLESIVNNQKMLDKEKKKKIKQFKESYPEIYLDRFPTTASEALIFSKKPKTTLFSRILSMRL